MFGVEKVEESWPEYGIEEYYLTWNGEPIPWKAIVRRGKLVHIASRKYRVLPLEVSVKASDEAAKAVGAVKIREFYNTPDNTRVYVLYDLMQAAEPIRGVRTRLGFYTYNSIDGSLAFGASMLSILDRGNGTFYGFIPTARLSTYLSPTAAIAIVRRPHTPGIETDVGRIAGKLREMVERGREAIAVYRLWAELELDREIARTVVERLPEAYIPRYVKALSEGVTLSELVTVWDAYVDISSMIWRGRTSGKEAKIDRKIELYRMLHSALPTPRKEPE